MRIHCTRALSTYTAQHRISCFSSMLFQLPNVPTKRTGNKCHSHSNVDKNSRSTSIRLNFTWICCLRASNSKSCVFVACEFLQYLQRRKRHLKMLLEVIKRGTRPNIIVFESQQLDLHICIATPRQKPYCYQQYRNVNGDIMRSSRYKAFWELNPQQFPCKRTNGRT